MAKYPDTADSNPPTGGGQMPKWPDDSKFGNVMGMARNRNSVWLRQVEVAKANGMSEEDLYRAYGAAFIPSNPPLDIGPAYDMSGSSGPNVFSTIPYKPSNPEPGK